MALNCKVWQRCLLRRLFSSDQRSLISPECLKMERVREKDLPQVMEFIQKFYFPHEPLMGSLRLRGCRIEPQLHQLIKSFVTQGMSIKCVEADSRHRIVGVSVNRRLTPADAAKIEEEAAKCVSPFSRRLMDTWVLMNSSPSLFTRYKDDEIFDIWLGAVHSELRNRGVGKQLVLASFCLARELNYKTISMDCTNKFSSIIARQLDMNLHWECPFRMVTGRDVPCTHPHSHIQVFGRKVEGPEKSCVGKKLVRPEEYLRGRPE